MKILDAEFVTSLAVGGMLPRDLGAVVAMVGRSNVGKSSLVNALARRRIARAGAKPGTTRLVNLYAVRAAAGPRTRPVRLTLADLPGYGFARGGDETRREFETLTREFFDHVVGAGPAAETRLATAVLVVDGRHPGLASDRAAQTWLAARDYPRLVVTTKNDRLARGARVATQREHERTLDATVLAVSTKTGEGVGAVWTALIAAAAAARGSAPGVRL